MILPTLYIIHEQRAYTFKSLEEYNNFIDELKDELNDWDVSFYSTSYDYLKHNMNYWTEIIDDLDADNILTYRNQYSVEISCKTKDNHTFVLFFVEHDEAKECFESGIFCKKII